MEQEGKCLKLCLKDLRSVKEKKNHAIKRGHDRGRLEPFLRIFSNKLFIDQGIL